MSGYVGSHNLDVMDHAVNYNNHLRKLVISYALPADKILDFGAGIGTFAIPLANNGLNISCVESDQNQLRRITEHGIPGYLSINDIPDKSFDYVYTLNVLEHIEKDQDMLCELFKKLKPGGRMLIYVPAFQALFSSMDRAVGHFRRYTITDLSSKIVTAEFEISEARYVDSLGFFATMLYKHIGTLDRPLNIQAVVIYDRNIFPISLLLDKLTHRLFGKNLLIVAERR